MRSFVAKQLVRRDSQYNFGDAPFRHIFPDTDSLARKMAGFGCQKLGDPNVARPASSRACRAALRGWRILHKTRKCELTPHAAEQPAHGQRARRRMLRVSFPHAVKRFTHSREPQKLAAVDS